MLYSFKPSSTSIGTIETLSIVPVKPAPRNSIVVLPATAVMYSSNVAAVLRAVPVTVVPPVKRGVTVPALRVTVYVKR